jgi:hypothetical protein
VPRPIIINKKWKKIELYFLYWISYLLLFTAIQGLTERDFFTVFRNEFFSLIPKTIFVAIVIENLAVDLLFRKKIARFVVAYVLLVIVFAFLLRLVDNYIILRYYLLSWRKEPLLSIAPFLYNTIKLQFVLTIPFCVKLWRHFTMERRHVPQFITEEDIAIKNSLISRSEDTAFLYIKCERRMIKLLLSSICYCEAQGNYLVIFTTNGSFKTYLSISELEDKLPAAVFARIHRSYIVALDRIESHNNSQVTIGDKKIPIGRSYMPRARNSLS